MEEDVAGTSGRVSESGEAPPTRMSDKLDKDFVLYLSYAPLTYRNLKEHQEMKLSREWLRRLSQRQPQSEVGKRNRNLYMVNLILQMGDGKLSEPFTSSPPPDKLHPPNLYFQGIHPSQPCTEDMNLDIEDHSEFSKDGRMYFASKSLGGGQGAFAYLGLSSGGGDTVWLDSQGEPICGDILKKMRGTHKEPDPFTDGILRLVSERSPHPERSGLLTFYQGLLNQVNETILTYGTCKEPRDQLIEQLIEDLQTEALEDGTLLSESVSCYTRLHWLQELQQKLHSQLNTASSREMELTRIEEDITEKDEIMFLDLSNSVSSPRADTMFNEAAMDRPALHTILTLKKYYPECIVQKLLMLLEKEKFNMIYQERSLYQDFISQMKSEIIAVVKNGLEKYSVARKEWHRVMLLMRQVEEAKSRILQDSERASSLLDPDFHDKECLLDDELGRAKRKLEEGGERSESIEIRIGSLHDQLHNMALELVVMKEEGEREKDRLALEMCHLQEEVKRQERKLAHLKETLNVKRKETHCRQTSCSRH